MAIYSVFLSILSHSAFVGAVSGYLCQSPDTVFNVSNPLFGSLGSRTSDAAIKSGVWNQCPVISKFKILSSISMNRKSVKLRKEKKKK